MLTGFEPRTSEVGNDRSTNWATTISHPISATRLGDLLDFGQVFKAFGNN